MDALVKANKALLAENLDEDSPKTLQERVDILVEANRSLLAKIQKTNVSQAHFTVSREDLVGALVHLSGGILISDNSTGNILATNSEFERIVGLSAADLLGKNLFAIYNTPKGWGCYDANNSLWPLAKFPSYLSSTNGQICKNVELVIRRRDGTEIWVLTSSAPILDETNHIYASSLLILDINDYKRSEEKLRKNEERLNYALTAADEGLWDFDYLHDDGYLSPKYYTMLGYENQDFDGNEENWIQLLHPDDRKGAVGKFRDMMEARTDSYESTYRLRTKNGQYRWILSRGLVVKRNQENSRAERIVGTHLDVTELRNMEDALREANEKLRETVRHRTEKLNKSILVSNRIKDELTELNLLDTKGQEFVAESPEMQLLLKRAIKISRRQVSNILITGDSGTGKGRLAKFIHEISKNPKSPFVQINCAALPESLLEAELFGYDKGAFTGAKDEGKAGLFELAEGGTLFLDEIGDLPITIQAKLLKYLDEKEILHLGGLIPIKINCMVIAATNVNLAGLIEQKKFREDLFFRLNTFPIKIPPLSERPEDIYPLTQHFVKFYNEQYGLTRSISSQGFNALQNHEFRGNVRELRNFINKAVVLSEEDLLDSMIIQELQTTRQVHRSNQVFLEQNTYDFEHQVAAFEIKLLTSAMKKHKTTRAIAAHLNMSQSAVVRRLKKHGLSQ